MPTIVSFFADIRWRISSWRTANPRPLELPERARNRYLRGLPIHPTLRHRRQIQGSPKTEGTDPENRSQTSTIGDTTNHSPKTEDRPIPQTNLTSLFGDKPGESPKTEVTHPENRTLTSVIGDTTNHSPKTEDRPIPQTNLSSAIGDKSGSRRRRKLHTPKTGPQPPPSATPPTTRRRRKLHDPRMNPKPPSSATPVQSHPPRHHRTRLAPPPHRPPAFD